MSDLRAEIDRIDTVLMALLAERLAYADRAPSLKMAEGISAAAPSRTAEVLGKVRAGAQAAGFDAEIAASMWQVMIEGIVAREERVMGRQGEDG